MFQVIDLSLVPHFNATCHTKLPVQIDHWFFKDCSFNLLIMFTCEELNVVTELNILMSLTLIQCTV